MKLAEILLFAAVILGGLSCLWFFVIHKHVTTIHAKVDTILNKVSSFGRAPGMPSTVGEPQPQKKP